ncbi:response regulator [Burkholderiaceae bacterium DAT-1]|nr:response regulator [Burkholderiaceae bacterium DAT-1]
MSVKLLKFLVVDDSMAVRQVVSGYLREFGIEQIVQVSSGREALNSLKRGKFDVVLSDLNMPNMSGLDLLRAMRSEPDLAEIPFLMITSEKDANLLKEVVTSGVTQILMKPFNMQQLQVKLSATLRKVKRPPKPDD